MFFAYQLSLLLFSSRVNSLIMSFKRPPFFLFYSLINNISSFHFYSAVNFISLIFFFFFVTTFPCTLSLPFLPFLLFFFPPFPPLNILHHLVPLTLRFFFLSLSTIEHLAMINFLALIFWLHPFFSPLPPTELFPRKMITFPRPSGHCSSPETLN